MRAVSPANAVGVMQVIPSTGEWVSSVSVANSNLLDPQDNVTAGVALLSYLTRNADTLDQAIAGYYQGLVRRQEERHEFRHQAVRVVGTALMKKFD